MEQETVSKKRVMVAIPSRDGMVSQSNITALLGFHRIGLNRSVELNPYLGAGVSDIAQFRNLAANVALENNMDAILFIDSDIEYSEQAMLKAFWAWENTGFGIIAAAYPKKEICTDRITELCGSEIPFQNYTELLSASHRYTVNDTDLEEVLSFKKSPWHNDPWAKQQGEARRIGWHGDMTGAGFLLIPCDSLRTIVNELAEPEHFYFDADKPDLSRYPFFKTEDGLMLGEDYSFCLRAKLAGLKLLILDTRVSHRGQYLFQGDIAATLKHGLKP